MIRTGRLFAGAVAIALAFSSPVASATPQEAEAGPSYAIRAKRMHMGDGSVVEDGVLLVEDGRVSEVGRAVTIPPGVLLVEHDGDLSAGLVALHDYSGAAGETVDSTRAMMPTATLAHALRPGHSDFERLAQEGVTTIVLSPGSRSVIGGQTAVVKVGTGRVLKDNAHLHLSFSGRSLPTNRYPSSYAAAISELDQRFTDPKGVFASASAGRMLVLLEAGDKHEIQRALAFAGRHGLNGALLGASRAGELADEIKAAGLAVIFRPFQPGMESRSLKTGAALAKAGVPFGFALDAPDRHPVSLRMSAAAFVREGLEPAAAWRALTSDAALIAGVANRVGRLSTGQDADFVLWSGPPLDLGSRVQAVYVDGTRVFGGQE